MENYIRVKEGFDDFYYEEFNILKSEIQKDIKVEIIVRIKLFKNVCWKI